MSCFSGLSAGASEPGVGGVVTLGFQPWSWSPDSGVVVVLLASAVLMILTSPVVVAVSPVVVAGGAIVGLVMTGLAAAGFVGCRVRFFFFVCASAATRPT